MKHDDLNSLRYRVVLVYEDGSFDSVEVIADDVAEVMMIARGWLLTSSSAISVQYHRLDLDGRHQGLVGGYIK